MSERSPNLNPSGYWNLSRQPISDSLLPAALIPVTKTEFFDELKAAAALHHGAVLFNDDFQCLASRTDHFPEITDLFKAGQNCETALPELFRAVKHFIRCGNNRYHKIDFSLQTQKEILHIQCRINRSPWSGKILVTFDHNSSIDHDSSDYITLSEEGTFIFFSDPPMPLTQDPALMTTMLLENFKVAECNILFARELGFERVEDIIGLKLKDIILPGLTSAWEMCRQFIESDYKINGVELARIDQHGNILYSSNTVNGIIENNKLVKIYGSIRNITTEKHTENTLLHYGQVMDNISEAVISTDLDYNIISWNRTAEEYYGLSFDEVKGKNFRELITHHYLSGTPDSALGELIKTGNFYGEAYYLNKKGEKKFVTISLSYLINNKDEKVGYASVHKDITGRLKADEALHNSEERYRSLVNALGEGIVMMDKEGKYLTHNSSLVRIFGDDFQALANPSYHPEFYKEDGTLYKYDEQPILITAQTGRSFKGVIMRYIRSSGKELCLSVNTEPIYYSGERNSVPDAVVVTMIDVTQIRIDSEKLAVRDRQLKDYAIRISKILDSITHGFIATDLDMNVLLWNSAIEQVTGISFEKAKGLNVKSVLPEFISDEFYKKLTDSLATNQTTITEIYNPIMKIWIEASAFPSDDGIFVYLRDITLRKRQDRILKIEKTVLQYSANPDVTLSESINFFLKNLECIFSRMSCCLIKQSGEQLTLYPSPRFPIHIKDYIESVEIAEEVSAWINEYSILPVNISEPVKNTPLNTIQKLFHENGVSFCWSVPVMNSNNITIATLVTCFEGSKYLSGPDREIIEKNSKVLGTIMSGKIAEQNLQISNERYLLATRATNDAIYDWDMAGGKLVWGEMFYTLFGYSVEQANHSYNFWESIIHPDDIERFRTNLFKFVRENNTGLWVEEYRIKDAFGNYRIINDRGFQIFNQAGEVCRMVGSVQDITVKRILEKKLLNQELEKSQLVAQAVVEAQDKERGDIGKELHDNVNQILSTARLYLELAKTEEKQRLSLIERSSATILSAINEIRIISRSLVPSSIDDLGLIESVNDLIENIRFTQTLEVHFSYSGEIESVLNQPRKLMIFRIIQEQVNNVLKHANAANLTIEMEGLPEYVYLMIKDDGKGFDKNNIKNKKGVGLSNITSRAELFNGRVQIDSSPEKGCKLMVKVPISK